MIPAQSSGAAPARSRLDGTRRTKRSVDDDAVGVAAVGDAAEVLVGEVVGEGHVRAELLEAGLALGAGAVGVDQAADRGEVAGLELGDRGADLGDAADDLMAGNAGVDGGHHAAPLVAGLVEIGVADAAEENLDLHVVFGGIAPRDGGGGKRRCRAGGGISFCFVHGVPQLSRRIWRADSPVRCRLRNWTDAPSSGIPILPIYCLFLSMHGFLCTAS